jgi:hypothetical protein
VVASLRRNRREENLDEELRAHLEMLVEENIRRGIAAVASSGYRTAYAAFTNPKTEHRSPGVNPRNWRNRLLGKDLAEVVEAVLHLLKQ